jgi:hypothetical protein
MEEVTGSSPVGSTIFMNERSSGPEQKRFSKRWFADKLRDAVDSQAVRDYTICAVVGSVTSATLVHLGIPVDKSIYAAWSVALATRVEQHFQIVPRGLDYMEHLFFH